MSRSTRQAASGGADAAVAAVAGAGRDRDRDAAMAWKHTRAHHRRITGNYAQAGWGSWQTSAAAAAADCRKHRQT